jgi:hypothetical protein
MNTKIALALSVALLVAVAVWTSRATTAAGQDNQPHRQHNEEALKKAKVAYAEAVLKVSQADLNIARDANNRVAGTIPRADVRALENDVAIATARLQGLLGGKASGENPYSMSAKESLTFAEENLAQANNANARAPGAVPRPEVELRQATVELARAKLEVAKLMDGVDPLEVTRWELLQLQADIQNVRAVVRKLQYRN